MNSLGVLELRGPDARSFLQGYATCDLNELVPGRALEGGYCNLQGRLVTDFTLLDHDGALLLLVDRSVIPRATKSLAKYLMFSKSKLTDRSDAYEFFGVLDDATVPALPALPTPLSFAAYGERGFAIAIPGARRRTLVAGDAGSRLLESDWREWIRIDIESMRAHVTDATSEAFLPQMWGLEERGAISFTKGCYLGQEVVARAQHRGQVKRSLGRLRWRGTLPAPGLVIRERNGSSNATVVSAVDLARDEGLALAIGAKSAWATTLHADGTTFDPA